MMLRSRNTNATVPSGDEPAGKDAIKKATIVVPNGVAAVQPVKRQAAKSNSSSSASSASSAAAAADNSLHSQMHTAKGEPKPKRAALADVSSGLTQVLSSVLIDSTKKATVTAAAKPLTRGNVKARPEKISEEDLDQSVVVLPDIAPATLGASRQNQSRVVPPLVDPCPGVDFDKENEKDPYAISAYAMDIFRYQRLREPAFAVTNYLPKHPELSDFFRAELVDWMVEIQETFELNHETLYLSVKLVDIFLSRTLNYPKSGLRLLASAAIFVASKFDERQPPLIEDFLYVSDGAFKGDDLIRMERELLRTVTFDLGIPISYTFVRRYARVIKADMQLLTLARYVLETSLMFYEVIPLSDSLVAASAMLLALRQLDPAAEWSPVLQKYSEYSAQEVEPVVGVLNQMMLARAARFPTADVIFKKYSHEVFHQVAAIPHLAVSRRQSSTAPLVFPDHARIHF